MMNLKLNGEPTISELKKIYIETLLRKYKSSYTVADVLKMHVSSLYRQIKSLGIDLDKVTQSSHLKNINKKNPMSITSIAINRKEQRRIDDIEMMVKKFQSASVRLKKRISALESSIPENSKSQNTRKRKKKIQP